MRDRPLFFCFSGIDGSGKTTCAKLLVQHLEEQGIPTRYVWLNPRPLLLAPLRLIMHKTLLRGEDIGTDYVSYHQRRHAYASRWRFLRKVYYSIMLLDYLIWVYWNLWPWVVRKSAVVCDRYLYDMVVNLGEIVGYSAQEEIRLIQKLAVFFPKPNLVIVCDVEEATALQRKNDTPHISMLVAQRPKYRRIAEGFGFPIIDTSFSLNVVTCQLREVISRHAEMA